MAIHSTLPSLLKESIPEFLKAAEYCVEFRKDAQWGIEQVGGCLGYPATALMFSIVDSIGSYHRSRRNLTINIDGKPEFIKASQHFFILNSEYYNLALSRAVITKLYDNYRNLLLHNSALAVDYPLVLGDPDDEPFVINSSSVQVNVAAFLRVTKIAVEKFLLQIDNIVPGSEQENIILKK